jgi:hypothetical protein
MNSEVHNESHWDTPEYSRIESARFDEDTNELSVRFADGSTAVMDPGRLLPRDLPDVDWWRVASNRIEIIVPSAGGWFEIPWDVVRRETDPVYADFWEGLARQHAGRVGLRVTSIRRQHGLSVEEFAERAQIASSDLLHLESGGFPLDEKRLQQILETLGLSLTEFFSQDVEDADRYATSAAGAGQD